MPDLVALAGKLGAVPDVFIRDSVTDAGNVPSGKVTMSPDIIVRNNPVPNAAGTFGEAGPWVNAAPPIDAVRVDQPNYLYVRLRNRSLVDATGVTVKLYWSKTSPLMAPFHWNFIGQLTGILVPAGGTLTVAGPFTWTPATGQLPTSDPGCFIAVAHHPLDPRPPLLPASTSWGKFLTYVRRNNNVARRSFSTIEPSPTSAGYAAAPFVIRGAGDEAREFSFQVVQQLPEGVRLWWDVPSELAAMIRRAACVEADQEGEGDGRRRLLLPRRRRLDLPSLILDADAEYPCTLHVVFPRSARPPGMARSCSGSCGASGRSAASRGRSAPEVTSRAEHLAAGRTAHGDNRRRPAGAPAGRPRRPIHPRSGARSRWHGVCLPGARP